MNSIFVAEKYAGNPERAVIILKRITHDGFRVCFYPFAIRKYAFRTFYYFCHTKYTHL